jgi:hypothetical protein
MRFCRHALLVTIIFGLTPHAANGQEAVSLYAGAIAGVATLSGDARAQVSNDGFASSSYNPDNGPALNLLFGAHLREYITVQVNYIWNRNDLVLFSGATSGDDVRFYEEQRESSQHSFIADLLIYFRERNSRVRPYLSGGIGVVRLESVSADRPVEGGAPVAPPTFASTELALRVAVGVDIPVRAGWNIRYSFSESISRNPIGRQLDPPGSHSLMNFQNLVGVMYLF